MAYNHSDKNGPEKIILEPTDVAAGRVRSLHATKGFRESRIAPLDALRRPTLARRFYDHILMGRRVA